jgi:hypothetical protein
MCITTHCCLLVCFIPHFDHLHHHHFDHQWNHLKVNLQLEACVHFPWWKHDTKIGKHIHHLLVDLVKFLVCMTLSNKDVFWRYVLESFNDVVYSRTKFCWFHTLHPLDDLVILVCWFNHKSEKIPMFYLHSNAFKYQHCWRSKINDM